MVFGLGRKKKEIDMSEDTGRRQFIEEAMKNPEKEKHIPTDIITPSVPIPNPPPIAASAAEESTKEQQIVKFKTPMIFNLKLRVDNVSLFVGLNDSLNEIIEKYGVESILSSSFEVDIPKQNIKDNTEDYPDEIVKEYEAPQS